MIPQRRRERRGRTPTTGRENEKAASEGTWLRATAGGKPPGRDTAHGLHPRGWTVVLGERAMRQRSQKLQGLRWEAGSLLVSSEPARGVWASVPGPGRQSVARNTCRFPL